MKDPSVSPNSKAITKTEAMRAMEIYKKKWRAYRRRNRWSSMLNSAVAMTVSWTYLMSWATKKGLRYFDERPVDKPEG